MSVLEDKIKKNRQHYDVHEPDEGHHDRFASRLDEVFHAGESKSAWPLWRIAAAIVLVAVLSGVLIFQYSNNSSSQNPCYLLREKKHFQLKYVCSKFLP